MIICNQCGAALKDGVRFCNECGTPVPGAQPPVTNTLDETLVRPPVIDRTTHDVVNPPPPPVPPRPSIAVPLVVLGVILGGGFLLLLGISASRTNSYNSYNSYNGYTSNSTNTTNTTNTNANYSTNTGNMNSNRGNTNSGYTTNTNTNTGGYTSSTPARSGFDYVESKILNDSYLSSSDLNGLSLWQLRLLRNTVFAKYGRTYPKPEDWSMQQHFNSRPWYSPNENYNSNQQYVSLTSADEANLVVIKQAENSP